MLFRSEALQRAQFERVQALMQNDFYEATVSRTPEVAAAVKALLAAGAGRVLLATDPAAEEATLESEGGPD